MHLTERTCLDKAPSQGVIIPAHSYILNVCDEDEMEVPS